MQARGLCCCNNLLGLNLAEPCNVLGNAAIKELDVLGKVANVRPKFVAVPARDGALIKQHFACHLRPYANHHTRQGRFSRPRGAKHHRDGACRRKVAHSFKYGFFTAIGRGNYLVKPHDPLGGCARQGTVARWKTHHQCFQALKGFARTQELFPACNQQVNWGKRTGGENVGGNHGTWRNFTKNDQVGTRTQRERLLRVTNEFAVARHAVGQRLAFTVGCKGLHSLGLPTGLQVACHAKGLEHLGTANLALQELHFLGLRKRGLFVGRKGSGMPKPCKQGLNNDKDNGHVAKKRMQ